MDMAVIEGGFRVCRGPAAAGLDTFADCVRTMPAHVRGLATPPAAEGSQTVQAGGLNAAKPVPWLARLRGHAAVLPNRGGGLPVVPDAASACARTRLVRWLG